MGVVAKDSRRLETPSSEESGMGNSCELSNQDSSEPEAALVVPPDGGWGWVVVAASFICNMLVDGVIFSAGLINEHFTKEWPGTSKGEAALVTSLLSGFYLLGGPFVSALANRYGFRAVTIIGSVIACCALCVSYFATSVEFLYVFYGIIGGIGFCMVYMPAVITVGFYFERWRALATGLALCGSGVGTFVVAPITTTILESHGWKTTIIVHGLLALICMICGLAFRPITPVTVHLSDEDEAEAETKRHEEAVEKLNVMLKIQQKLDSGISIPNELRPVRPTAPHTWMGVPSNTTYPTAADVFRGSGNALNRRSSANAATIKGQLKAQKYLVVPVAEDEEPESNAAEENNEPLLETKTQVEIRPHGNPKRTLEPVSRPFYRDDIFFSGSLARLPQYKSHTSLGYHMAVTHVPTKADVQEERKSRCKFCPEAVRRTLATMLDVSLFKSPTFLVLAFSGFLTMLGFFVPYGYVTERANKAFEWRSEDSIWLVSAIGAANTVGRIVCGLVSSSENVSALWINNIAVTIGGVATAASVMSGHVAFQYVYCIIFGLSVACFASLRSILVVEYMGLERLTNCFGLLLLFQGFGALLGAPIAGTVLDATGSYDLSFYLSGFFLLLSALICYPIDCISRWEKNRTKNTNRV